ncbi:MAG: ABC transporter permease [Devosia sp.]|jgi:ABC-2 type transport system permease protein|nr:ABC transporter permease [Devosia sp.]
MADTVMQTPVARVVVPQGGLGHELRATLVVWTRELIRFRRDPARVVSSVVQPLLFLFVLGGGLSALVAPGTGGVDFKTFLFPGVMSMSVLFTAAFAGISMVWDREFGFLREMLVAPVSTAAILTGKCLGGASVATLQAVIVILLAGLVGVPYDPLMILELLVLLFIMSFMITALGLVLASRVKQVQSAMPLVQMIITPLMFLSGALFPLSRLPAWLTVVTHINPMTYAVEPVRAAVFDRLNMPAEARAILDPGIWWGSYQVPVLLQVGLVIAASLLLLLLAVKLFNRTE